MDDDQDAFPAAGACGLPVGISENVDEFRADSGPHAICPWSIDDFYAGIPATVKVLIVDDSEIVRARLADLLLEVEGVESVVQAHDAQRALDLLNIQMPDVAIFDVRMPRRSGIDLLEIVKRIARAPKIIMLTNYATPENREKCLNMGADYFFDKSSEIEKVMNVLRNMNRDLPSQHH